jgi:CheY-like chemotaxis protein
MSTATRIFLVEDDTDDQTFFKEALDTIQDTLLLDIAENGQEALAKLRGMPIYPDIIFMDINMPVMNGIDCLREIKSTPGLKAIPVVILSTNIDGELIHSLDVGAFIKKPTGPGELRKDIDHALHLLFHGTELAA